MDAGKSTALLQAAHNYKQQGMSTFLLTAALDTRYGVGMITSRLGIDAPAHTFNDTDNLLQMITASHKEAHISCVLVDEAQFLKKAQVQELSDVVDILGIPVICYGLRTDFMGEPFEGSKYLLALVDKIEEIKTVCKCGRKATMVLRLNEKGEAIKDGEQINSPYMVIYENNRTNGTTSCACI